MTRFPRALLAFGLVLCLAAASVSRGQDKPADPPAAINAPALQFNYPDTPSGLEKLAKDILKAQKDGDTTRATALVRNLVLPDPRAWYAKVFGQLAAANEGASYEADRNNIPEELGVSFTNALQGHFTAPIAKRFDKSCDDNAGEYTFGILQSRLEPVPLYELRLFNGDHFRRFWILVYIDGGFRFVLPPKFPEHLPLVPKLNSDSSGDTSKAGNAEPGNRIRMGGTVTAAKIIERVQPQYPDIARSEHLQGTARLHAIIGKDGNISHLRVEKGACSLAQASFDAVRKWRYAPTLLQGQPVEVDTTIDVIFSLSYP